MKVAIFGSNGMAGHVITKYLKQQNIDVITVARDRSDLICDIENLKNVDFTLSHLTDYDFVINCIGLLVKDSIDNPGRAVWINGWFPHYLEQKFKDTKTKVIHLSTDCVFDGKDGWYKENDFHTEKNMYGRSKSIGEINNNKDITFRMSIIGTELKEGGSGLLNWTLTNKSEELSGWSNAWWNGITTLQLAKCIFQYMNDSRISGVYQLVNNDLSINKYELLCAINEVFSLGKKIIESNGPKNVNKILVDTRKEVEWNIPSDYKIMLEELRVFSESR